MAKDLYLPVEIAGLTFKNPFYVASGPTTKSVKQLVRIEQTGWAAASIKLTIDPYPYINRKPRYAVFKDRNALCFTAEKRLDTEEGLALIDGAKKHLSELLLMANITYAGDDGVEGWVRMAKRFEDVGADIIELNMCCPNMSYNLEVSGGDDTSCTIKTGASLGQHEEEVAEIIRAIKSQVRIPLFVKLTPEGGRIAQISKALYEAGADSVGGTANRLAIPPIDLDHPGKSAYHLQNEISMSCHSGQWLKPLALRDTYEMRKLNGPGPRIHAAGGIRNASDAAEIMMCGADLVGICSETLMNGYDIVNGIVSDLKDYMASHGYATTRDMRDLVVPEVRTAADLTLRDGFARITAPDLQAPCKAACPHHVPAQGYVRSVARGDFKRAYELIMTKNPLQSVCGWVCDAACEEACTRGEIGTPIPIRDIKRFVIEHGEARGWVPEIAVAARREERVAVVGSGPAGLSAAWHLTSAGYGVTVFERETALGGMLRYGLPAFRMNRAVLDHEILVLTGLGIRFETGKALGKDFTIASLKADGFAAVFVGTGAQAGMRLGVPGEDAAGVMPALELLKRVNQGETPSVGRSVVVVGGGYTAVDAARTAVRLGAEKVYIAYRRTRDEMPASAAEIREAEEEGVRILYLVKPTRVETRDGKVVGLALENQTLGGLDASKRRKPEGVEGAEFVLACDTVVSAVGQRAEPAVMEALGQPFVFSGGDVDEVATVIAAISGGRRAACSIDRLLAGAEATLVPEPEASEVDKQTVLSRAGYFHDGPKVVLSQKDGPERVREFAPFVRTLTETEAVKEASRCLDCGCGEGCGLCARICSDFAIHLESPDVWKIHEEECVACGMCFNRCPNGNIAMIERVSGQ